MRTTLGSQLPAPVGMSYGGEAQFSIVKLVPMPITPSQVYGAESRDIIQAFLRQEGWRVLGFRVPTIGDQFLDDSVGEDMDPPVLVIRCNEFMSPGMIPRLIVTRVMKP